MFSKYFFIFELNFLSVRNLSPTKSPLQSQGRIRHYMKEVVASVKTKGQCQPVKTKNMTKPKNTPVPTMVQKWVPKIAMPAKSIDLE
jgi:hypothetical protein